jgi:hypothetical protein
MQIRMTRQPLLALLFVSIFLASAYSQTPRRNLRDYKQGEKLDLKDEHIDVEKTNRQLAPARQFLWELWKTQTRGYLQETSYSIEGNPGWCTLFVEPDASGKWRVVVECRVSICPFISKKRCEKYLRTPGIETYDSVERIDSRYDVFSKAPPKFSDDENVNPLDFRLIFRSSVSGKTGQL